MDEGLCDKRERVCVEGVCGDDLEDLGLVLELVDQVINALDDLAALALGGLSNLEDLEAGLDINTKLSNSQLGQGLLLGLHDVGQRGVAGGVEAVQQR